MRFIKKLNIFASTENTQMVNKYFSNPDYDDLYQNYSNVRVRGKCWTLYLKDSKSSVNFDLSTGNV